MSKKPLIRAFQWDLARQVERIDALMGLLPRYAEWGYQELYLHLEDAVDYPSIPGIARADAYSYAELSDLVAQAKRCGIGVVPIVNLLGHTQYLIKHPGLRELNELRNEQGDPLVSGQICPLHPRTSEIAEKLLRDMAPFCTTGKVHVGLDESFHLGKCPRCREEVSRVGLGGHFAGHVNRLHDLANRQGLKLGLWADMFYFVPDAIPQLPSGITVYDWYYYPFRQAPRVEFFNFAERDLYPAFAKQGIHYYGCPMNGAFRYEPLPVFGDRLANIRSWWERCHRVEAAGMLITSWEAYRLALETTTVVDAAAANLWLTPERNDATTLLADGLQRVFPGRSTRAQARALIAADEHAFAGYARWQINDRWDVFAGTESVKPYRAELRFFTRLLRSPLSWPPPFAASLAFRTYLAQRDVFVRQAARDVFQCRRTFAKRGADALGPRLQQMKADTLAFAEQLKAGVAAARDMWNRTRDRSRRGQNLALLESDRKRLVEWNRWLARISHHPALIAASSPVAGAWQIQFLIHNSTPAVTKVAVEAQQSNGSWEELASRYTIEFRAHSARPTSKTKREFTAPVPDLGTPLRLATHGVGQVVISTVTLTDGIRVFRERALTRRITLGTPAPSQGLPDIHACAATAALRFRDETDRVIGVSLL